MAVISRHTELGIDLVGEAVRIVAEAFDLGECAAPAMPVIFHPGPQRFAARAVARPIDTELGPR
jgi:hypothetical protein